MKYEYKCTSKKCGHVQDEFRSIKRMDEALKCEKCEAPSSRVAFPEEDAGGVTIMKEGWRMGAVLGTGQKVQGHFGKDAGKKRRRNRE